MLSENAPDDLLAEKERRLCHRYLDFTIDTDRIYSDTILGRHVLSFSQLSKCDSSRVFQVADVIPMVHFLLRSSDSND